MPGKAAAAAVGGKKDTSPDTDDDLEKTKYQGFFNEIKSGFKFFMTDGLSEKPGYGLFQEPPKDVVKKEREAKKALEKKLLQRSKSICQEILIK